MKRPSRFSIFLTISLILVLGLLFQYARIMVGPGEAVPDTALSFPLVERGPIYDRNGKLLAVSTRLHSVSAWIPNLTQPEESAQLLAEHLNMDSGRLLKTFNENRGFAYIKRKVTAEESDILKELKAQGKLKGISLEREFGRSYPDRNLASTLLGYVGTDNTGLAGIEYSLNDILLPPLTGTSAHPTGNSVFLTVDMNIQYFLREAAVQALEEQKAESVTILVADALNGEILGYVDYPDFDPNNFSKFSPFSRQNRIAEKSFEPGSVFKIFSVAQLLEKKSIAPFSTFQCNGSYEKTMSSGEVVKIKCNGVHGRVTPEDIIRYSCNAGAAYASDLMDSKTFETALRDMGFGRKTGLPFTGEAEGIFPSRTQWSGRTKPTIAFGQEIGVTVLQMIQAGLSVAHQGDFMVPRLVSRVVSPTGEVLSPPPQAPEKKVFSPETANLVLDMLTRTVETGTGQRARIEGIPIGGKTGTSQVRDSTTGRYSDENFIASMMTFMPATAPQFIIYVLIDHPRGSSIQGGQIAAPVTKKIGERLIHYYGLAKTGDRVVTHDGKAVVAPVRPLSLGDTMPDLRGYPKRALLPLMLQEKFKTTLKGEGWVVDQTPEPGTPLAPGTEIILELR